MNKNIITFAANNLEIYQDILKPSIIFRGEKFNFGNGGISICKLEKLCLLNEYFESYSLSFHSPSGNKDWYELSIFFKNITVVIYSEIESDLETIINKYFKIYGPI